jgi:hypothetical protein
MAFSDPFISKSLDVHVWKKSANTSVLLRVESHRCEESAASLWALGAYLVANSVVTVPQNLLAGRGTNHSGASAQRLTRLYAVIATLP